MATPRILLCGDVLGRFNQLFKRVSAVNKSNGPFDALLCVGQFFPTSSDQLDELLQYANGLQPVLIPTYFIGDYGVGAAKVLSAASKDPANHGFKMDGLKICDNLYWLKGSGKFSLHGLSVAYLSGCRASSGQPTGVYSEDDVDALRALAEEPGVIDLFLTTNEWPTRILNKADTSDVSPEILNPSGTDAVVSQLSAELKPRYHIAGTKGVFYGREPYSNDGAVHVTRFLGLALVGNKDKQKFIHAISPTPASRMSAVEISLKPPNTTLSPYKFAGQKAHAKETTKRADVSDEQYWRFDVSQKRRKHENEDGGRVCFDFTCSGSCSRGERCNFRHDTDARDRYFKGCCFDFISRGKCERGSYCNFQHSLKFEGDSSCKSEKVNRSSDCWFCLSSPNLESHLILSIGESCYCALAKGPLVRDHVLVIPIEHCPDTLSLVPDAEIELQRFKDALKRYFRKQGKAIVFNEWLFKYSQSSHANLQAIPIPLSRASEVQHHFVLAAEKLRFEFALISPSKHGGEARKLLREQFDGMFSFFYVELPDGTILSHAVEDKQKFPVQFGREVLAGLLNMTDRADWRNCKLSKEDELQMAEAFKKRFEEFDPAQ